MWVGWWHWQKWLEAWAGAACGNRGGGSGWSGGEDGGSRSLGEARSGVGG